MPTVVSLLVVLLLLQSGAKISNQHNSPSGVLMQYGQVDERFRVQGLELRECLLIRNDGHYYLETRLQRSPETQNTLTSYEGVIDKPSMERLRRILRDPQLSALPDFMPPTFPLGTATFESIVVSLPEDNKVRQIGYFTTRDTLTSQPAHHDSQISATLGPLVSWVEHFKNGRLQRVQNGTGSCHLS
jgi:hypothetical protein